MICILGFASTDLVLPNATLEVFLLWSLHVQQFHQTRVYNVEDYHGQHLPSLAQLTLVKTRQILERFTLRDRIIWLNNQFCLPELVLMEDGGRNNPTSQMSSVCLVMMLREGVTQKPACSPHNHYLKDSLEQILLSDLPLLNPKVKKSIHKMLSCLKRRPLCFYVPKQPVLHHAP